MCLVCVHPICVVLAACCSFPWTLLVRVSGVPTGEDSALASIAPSVLNMLPALPALADVPANAPALSNMPAGNAGDLILLVVFEYFFFAPVFIEKVGPHSWSVWLERGGGVEV